MTNPLTTAVVVAFHRPEALSRLLDGLMHPGLHVVVVNVGGDDAVKHIVSECGFAACIQIPNGGYAAAVNRGVEKAATDAVVFMNDDLSIDGDVVVELGRRALAHHGAVVPKVVDTAGAVEPTLQAFASWRSLLLEWAVLPDNPPSWAVRLPAVQKWRRPTQTCSIDAAAAVVVGVPTAVLRSIPMPEDYFMYWEDNEWFWRLRQNGIGAEYAPDLVATHHGGREDVRADKSVLLARNAVRCVRRVSGRSQAALALPAVILWTLRLLAVDAFRAPLRTAARSRVPARIAGLRSAARSWREIR